MLNRLLPALLGILLPAAAVAEELFRDHLTGHPISLVPPPTAALGLGPVEPAVAAAAALRRYAGAYGVRAADLQPTRSSTDELGHHQVRFAQVYGGVPVYGAELIVHLYPDGSVKRIDGVTAPDAGVDTAPTLSSAAGEAAARTHFEETFHVAGEALPARLVIFAPVVLERVPASGASLAWMVDVLAATAGPESARIFIDAGSGRPLHIIPLTHHLTRVVSDCSLGNPCKLNYEYGWGGPMLGRQEGDPARGPHPVVTAHPLDTDTIFEHLGIVHDHYQSTFGINGANRAGGIGDGIVIARDTTWARVYVDNIGMECPGAYYNNLGFAFCAGMTQLDVVTHEYQHAVTRFSIFDAFGEPVGLLYTNESGAINEAYSDIFSELRQWKMEGSADWLIAPNLPYGSNPDPFRSLRDPPALGQGDTLHHPLFYCGTENYGGVHRNTGPLGKAAFLMATGGSFNGCTIGRVPRETMEQIFWRALTVYLTPTSSFGYLFQAVNQSCADLALGSTTCGHVRAALEAVLIDQPSACSGLPPKPPRCAAAGAPTPTPVPPRPGSISLTSQIKKKGKKAHELTLHGQVLGLRGNPISVSSLIEVSCKVGRKTIRSTVGTDPAGLYGVRVRLKAGQRGRCRAKLGEILSPEVAIKGPKKQRRR